MQLPGPLARTGIDAGSPDVDEAIANYQVELESLDVATAEDLSSRVLRVLLVRDALARAMTGSEALTAETLCRITQCDDRLRAEAPRVAVALGRSTLAGWRAARGPAAGSWWWSLDGLGTEAETASNPVWAMLAGVLLTLSLSLAAEISLRFLSGGADFLGVLSTFSQVLLAVLAGSAFTRAGDEWLQRIFSRLRVARGSQGAWKAALALAVLLVILALRLSLPAFARVYNNRGVRQQQEGRVASARQSFERAVRLYPDYAQAHFNLAGAYEETLDYDAAQREYQSALKMDERLYAAYNNLARLYILRQADHAGALKLLNAGIALEPRQPLVRYSLFKNRGWANLGLKYFGQAEDDLRQALALRPDGAAAHCLLAQVLEARGNEATAEWEACVAYGSSQEDDVEATWSGLARERLRPGKER